MTGRTAGSSAPASSRVGTATRRPVAPAQDGGQLAGEEGAVQQGRRLRARALVQDAGAFAPAPRPGARAGPPAVDHAATIGVARTSVVPSPACAGRAGRGSATQLAPPRRAWWSSGGMARARKPVKRSGARSAARKPAHPPQSCPIRPTRCRPSASRGRGGRSPAAPSRRRPTGPRTSRTRADRAPSTRCVVASSGRTWRQHHQCWGQPCRRTSGGPSARPRRGHVDPAPGTSTKRCSTPGSAGAPCAGASRPAAGPAGAVPEAAAALAQRPQGQQRQHDREPAAQARGATRRHARILRRRPAAAGRARTRGRCGWPHLLVRPSTPAQGRRPSERTSGRGSRPRRETPHGSAQRRGNGLPMRGM